ncbi:MAG: hypothetical protein JWQ25_1086 [Daejeonella sp.]|nr:hypothetical protein [Daejeonella sp.]
MKLKLFISSRNLDKLTIGGALTDFTMTQARQFLKRELEQVQFLDKEFFNVRINEDFGGDASTDSYNKCLLEVKESDFMICLYSGAGGWAPVGIDMGICHAELAAALDVSSKKTAYIDLTKLFIPVPKDAAESTRNAAFSTFVTAMNPFLNPLKPTEQTINGFKVALLASVKNIILQHLQERIKLSNYYYHISGNNKISLDWKKLKYDQREFRIKDELNALLTVNPDFEPVMIKAWAVPDNLSAADAKTSIGRPFLNDQELVDKAIAGGGVIKPGPIHFIGVYGNATELQVKNMIGYTDVSVIADDFGLYVWEQNAHVQIVFLTKCATPEAVKSKFLLFINWCRANGELDNMIKRCKARHMIMEALINAKRLTES